MRTARPYWPSGSSREVDELQRVRIGCDGRSLLSPRRNNRFLASLSYNVAGKTIAANNRMNQTAEINSTFVRSDLRFRSVS